MKCPNCNNELNEGQSAHGYCEIRDCDFCGYMWNSKQQSEISCLTEELSTKNHDIEALKKDVTLSVSQYCRNYGCQRCFICEDLQCCDNQSEAKKEISRLTAEVEKKDGDIANLKMHLGHSDELKFDALRLNGEFAQENASLRAELKKKDEEISANVLVRHEMEQERDGAREQLMQTRKQLKEAAEIMKEIDRDVNAAPYGIKYSCSEWLESYRLNHPTEKGE